MLECGVYNLGSNMGGKMKKTILTGKVWGGYIGEYKHPPIYIIMSPGMEGDTVFIDDILRKFMRKDIKITIECRDKKLSLKEIIDLGQD